MKDLAARISTLSPEAAEALKAITYFDELLAHGAGVKAIVRGAAVLAGVPTILIDRTGGESLRMLPSGNATAVPDSIDGGWPRAAARDGSLEIVLEREEPGEGQLDALVAERALLAVATAVGRTFESASSDEGVATRTVVDAKATPELRQRALHRLGLTPDTPVCVIAVRGDAPILVRSEKDAAHRVGTRRAGIGPMVPAREAPSSWKRAWFALCLTADATPQDPGDRVVTADGAGSLVWLAERIPRRGEMPEDLVAIMAQVPTLPWLLETLHAVSTTDSLRDAAAKLGVHHSTVQERITRASNLIGWDIANQRGKMRVHLALAIRRVRNALGTTSR